MRLGRGVGEDESALFGPLSVDQINQQILHAVAVLRCAVDVVRATAYDAVCLAGGARTLAVCCLGADALRGFSHRLSSFFLRFRATGNTMMPVSGMKMIATPIQEIASIGPPLAQRFSFKLAQNHIFGLTLAFLAQTLGF